MKTLLLETATDICSVGLLDGGNLLHEIIAADKFQHASHLTIFIRDCLTAAGVKMEEIDAVAVSDGPGSYTSLRVGAATAKGLCVALPGLKLLAVDTLLSIAVGAAEATAAIGAIAIVPCIASRRDEVYSRSFNLDGEPLDELRSESLTAASFAHLRGDGPLLFCGSGATKVRSILGDADDLHFRPDLLCRAANLVTPVQQLIQETAFRDHAVYEPTYLKPPFVTKSTKKLL